MGLPGQGVSRVAILYDRRGNPLPRPEAADLTETNPRTGEPVRTILGTVNPLLYPDTVKDAVLAESAPTPPP